MIGKVINNASSRITQHYNYRHQAVDLSYKSDENQNKIYALSSGTVIAAVDGKDFYPYDDGSLETYGNYVEIQHADGYKTRYAHLRKGTVCVSKGQQVNSSTQIGVIGESGYNTGRHLHFEVHKNGIRIDPEPYLNSDIGKTATYQSHDATYGWNPAVYLNNVKEYAGNFGYNLDGIFLDVYNLRVHDMVKDEWLPYVKNKSDYAGNLGHAIDAVQFSNQVG